MPDRSGGIAYVFGYGSLVELTEEVVWEGHAYRPVLGRLHGFARNWGAAMNNWEATEAEKHFVEPGGDRKPHIRVAYLDICRREGGVVNGLAIPADPERLEILDRREVNYERIDVSDSFRPALPHAVYAYTATEAARARCQAEDELAAVHVSADYVARIRAAFARLGEQALREYEQSTEPLRFPERELELRYPPPDRG